MRNKHTISVFVVLALLISMISGSFAIDASSMDGDNYFITTPYEYPITPADDQWKELVSHIDMIDACQIPENILNHMSTEALVETVLNYPLLSDMLAWSDKTAGFKSVASNFNGLTELLSRVDAPDILGSSQIMLMQQKDINDDENYLERNKARCATLILNNINKDLMTAYTLPEPQTGAIMTPSGSYVLYYKELTFVDLANLFDNVPFTETDFSDLELHYEKTYPLAEKIGPISPSYNCHSYAWYSTSTNNKYWLLDINPYIYDPFYVAVRLSDAKKGDKVVYIDNSDYPPNFVHSAIVYSVPTNSDFLDRIATSKWDFMGVYKHPIGHCPYAGRYYNVYR